MTCAVRIASGIPASEVQSWATPDAADVWMDANRNRTQGVFHLRPTFGVDGDGSRVVTALKCVGWRVRARVC